MKNKWMKICDSLYNDKDGLSGDVEHYEWEALKNNYNARAKELYKWSQDPKSNWSAAQGEPEKWEEEMLCGFEEEIDRAEQANEKSKASLKLQKTLEAIERDAVAEKATEEEDGKPETTLKKGFTIATNPYDNLQRVVSSLNDPIASAARKDEAEAKLLEAKANLIKAEAEAKRLQQIAENEKENIALKRFEVESAAELAKTRMEMDKKNSEAQAQMMQAILEIAKGKNKYKIVKVLF